MVKSFLFVSLSCLLTFILSFVLIATVSTGVISVKMGAFLIGVNAFVLLVSDFNMLVSIKRYWQGIDFWKGTLAVVLTVISTLLLVYYLGLFSIFITGKTGCSLCP